VHVVEASLWEGPIEMEVNGARVVVPLGLARAIEVEVGTDAAN
jgi:Fe2+ transport system protein FeoA